MPFIIEQNGKGYYERHSHCEEGPANPRSILACEKSRLLEAVNGYWNYDRDESD